MANNFLYKFLSSISFAAVILCVSGIISLLLMGILAAVLVSMNINDVPDSLVLISWIILFSLSLAGCLFAAWKFGRNKLVFEEKISRGQSFLLWETPAFLLFFLLFYLSWLTDWDWLILVGLSLPVIALITALVFPFRYCLSGFWKMIRGLGLFCTFSIFFWGSLFLCRMGKTVAYDGNNPAEFPRSVRWIGKQYIPERAAKIRLKGYSNSCGWSCYVTKKDFLKFKAKYPFDFIKKGTSEPYYFYEK